MIPLWVFIVTVVILIGIIINEIRINKNIKDNYELCVSALGYMKIRFEYEPTWENINYGTGLSEEQINKLMDDEES
jgi:hypothetical protein